MVVNDFYADVFALIQRINAGKEDEDTEQQPVQKPTPDKRMVKDIPGGYINGGDDHDYKDQIADNLARPFNDYINTVKNFIDDLTHSTSELPEPLDPETSCSLKNVVGTRPLRAYI